jgi:ABC-type multidrug transport system fused ATPase/permease subunit
MSDKKKSATFTARETAFSGQYSKSVFQTLILAYRPVMRGCLFTLILGFLGRGLLLSNANWIGYWADSFCKGPTCRPQPVFLQGWVNSDYLFILALVTALGFLLTVVFRVGFSRLSAEAISQIYDEVTLRTSRYPIQFFDTTPAGRIITRFSSDYGNVFRLFGGPLAELLSIIFELIWMVSLISLASPYFLPIVAVAAGCNFLIYRLNQQRLRRERRALSFTRSPSIAHFAETVQGASTIRAFLRQPSFINRFELLNNQYLNQKMRTAWVIMGFSFQMSSMTAMLLLSTGVASYWLTATGRVSIGSVGVAFTFITLAGGTLQMFFEWLAQFEEAMVGMERLDQYLRNPLEPGLLLPSATQFKTAQPRYEVRQEHHLAQDKLATTATARVCFKNVWLRYSPQLPSVLKGLSFEVAAGEKLGIVGRTGSGKSSLIQALFHLYPLERGCIRINGKMPLLQVDRSPRADETDLTLFRRSIGLIAQEPVLFQGTIRENLAIGEHLDRELISALERVGLAEWLQNYPLGLDGAIEERGRNLSLGERQLLCMARCLLQDAPILVMDEATSSVDPQSEEILLKATQEFFADRTQIIVAHRLSTLSGCNRILWLQNGEIAQLGTPQEVLPQFQRASLALSDLVPRPST